MRHTRFPATGHDPALNEEFLDLLAALSKAQARFIVVGAHAMAVHGIVRATGGLGVWIASDADNAQRVWSALVSFGAPVQALGLSSQDLARPDQVVQIGLPPRRMDILTGISGVDFADAWAAHAEQAVGGLTVPFLSREHLVQNKRAAGRAKDLADLEALGES